ncbi:tetratricopeptide repeat protein [Nocardia terpenica]|uniref:tetratricopeptide repeat protein n=1 Tax=Nocardia terpenica TaxID=455432 RepID=UPI0018856D24|nr:tetratricopeptide repeat protein [Nocardia terpenica]
MVGALGVGSVFAGYRIERLLGAGSTGEVYLARDRGLPRGVALKLLARSAGSDPDLRRRFLREADIVARLEHPNIVTVYARGEEEGQLWIAMTHVDGTDVGTVLRQGPLEPGRAVRIIADAADALDYAHDAGVLHRDVKPANILLAAAPWERAWLTDFGVAKTLDEGIAATRTGQVHASFQYAAPERVDADSTADRRADVYSLGCTLYHMLTGAPPFAGSSVAQMIYSHLKLPAPRPSAVNPALAPAFDEIIACALAKDPADRFDSCGQLAEAADQARTGTLSAATTVVVGRHRAGTDTTTTPEDPPPRPVVTTALPRDIATFLGRGRELRRILAAAGPGQVVSIHTIDGMAGVGKTALVTRAAHELGPEFPDGQLFVELHAHTPGYAPADPADVLARLLTGFGVDPRNLPDDLEGRRDLWRDRLADKRILLVLDDARDHAQIEPLLPSGTGCLTLITSRRRLIALDDALPLALDVLDPASAAELFVTLAHRAPVSDADAARVAEIVRACGYLPLAIVLLAGRLAHHHRWSIADLAESFTATTDRLAELDAADRAVRAAFDLSYRDLPERQRILFRRLGLHPGADLDSHAAAALAGIPLAAARRELEALYTVHLLGETGPGRYRLHDLLREYARTLVAADPDADNTGAVDRLLDYYRYTAANADRWLGRHTRPTSDTARPADGVVVRDFGDQIRALAWMRAESANLLACLEHIGTRDLARMVALTGVTGALLLRDGPWPLAMHLHQRAADAGDRLDDRLAHANALTDLGVVQWRSGHYERAAELYRRALICYREIGNRLGEANALTNLGTLARVTGDSRQAADLLWRALTRYREIGDRLGEAVALGNLGLMRWNTGNYDEAADMYRQALALYRAIGNRLGEANALDNLGCVCMSTGDHAQAADLHGQALALFRDVGDRRGEAQALTTLAYVHRETGAYEQSAELLEQSLALCRDIGNRRGEAHALTALGYAARETGGYERAADLLEQALTLNRDIGNRHDQADTLGNLGTLHERTGNYEQAADLHRQSLTLYRSIGHRLGQAEELDGIGRVLLATGEPGAALTSFTEALGLARAIGNHLEQARALDGVARCRDGVGDTPAALTDLRAALAIYRRLGVPETHAAAAYLSELEALTPGAARSSTDREQVR